MPVKFNVSSWIKALTLSLLLPTSLAHSSFAQANPSPPFQSYADLVAPLLPAVVNISTTTTIRSRGDGAVSPLEVPVPKGSHLEDFFKEFLDQVQPEGGPRNSTSVGSGFIIDPEGYIVTNNHLVSGADQITITLNDNTELKATLIGRDKRTDIALLKVNSTKKLPFVAWGNSEKLRTGDRIIAIGNPFGLGGTVTSGIVSHLARNIGSGKEADFVTGYIQTDASINVGNSGGPMFDMAGKVVGVNTAIYSPTGANVGIGFAIPSEVAKKVVDQIRQYGRTKRGWLGVHIQPVTEDIAEGLGLKDRTGALIGSVVKDGPAAKAKLQAGDVILKIGNVDVKDPHNLPRIVGDIAVGTQTPVTLWRKGKILSIPVTIGEYEEAEEAGVIPSPDGHKELAKGVEIHGITLQPLTEEVRQRFDIAADIEGVLVVDVKAKSSAAEKGIRAGDIIMDISQEEVKTPQEVVDQLKKAEKENRKSALLLINREGESRYVSIKLSPETNPQ